MKREGDGGRDGRRDGWRERVTTCCVRVLCRVVFSLIRHLYFSFYMKQTKPIMEKDGCMGYLGLGVPGWLYGVVGIRSPRVPVGGSRD